MTLPTLLALRDDATVQEDYLVRNRYAHILRLQEVGPDAPDSFDDELRYRVTLRSDENVLSESASAMMPRSIAYIST